MGLLKRLFSIGSKKNKKQRPAIVHNVALPEEPEVEGALNDAEHEAAVGRLLRSTSARFVERPEFDYASLRPIPHPINQVIQTPASSAVSLASSTLSQRGTYNVTVHQRTRHGSTEFPNANRGLEEKGNKRQSLLPMEDSRVLRLRSDPSVASLIDLYDEHGKLSNDAFSNSLSNSPPPAEPKKEERAQCRRSGSTLRQLLGAPDSLRSRHANDSGGEGDISWAERFLAETEALSSTSSLGLPTPSTPEFPPQHTQLDISFVTDADISTGTFDNPAISSMEVEINDSQNISQDLENLHKKNSPYSNPEPSTPQRASQIFGFLTRGKQSKPAEELMFDRTLPDPPSCFSSPSDENAHDRSSDSHIMSMDTSTDFTFAPTRFSAIPMPLIEDTPRPHHRLAQIANTPIPPRESQVLRSAFSDDSHDYHMVSTINIPYDREEPQPLSAPPEVPDKRQNDIKVIMNGPTKVIVTSATPSTNHNGPRLLRGPRAPPRKNSTGSVSRRRSALVELSNSSPNDPFTSAPPRHRPQHRRSSSTTSINSLSRRNSDRNADYHSSKIKKADFVSQHKENRLGLSVKTELPSTPLRSNTTGSRSLLRSVIQQSMFQPPVGMTPSPASSSSMSPIGQQMMMDVRQQRMKAREADRDKTSHRFASDRNTNRI